jgi:hypothetical protein
MPETTLTQNKSGQTNIAGYDYGKDQSADSPVTLEELRQLEASAGWTDDDARVLHRHSEIFNNRAEDMVDSWRAIIASQPHLVKWFFGPDGRPEEHYLTNARKRFVQWVRDICVRPHDQAWLDYQEEIGLRHTPDKKNRTDNAHTPSLVPLRYVYAFTANVAVTARKFFIDAGVTGEELQKLQDAWLKTVMIHVTLWSRPYVKDGLW